MLIIAVKALTDNRQRTQNEINKVQRVERDEGDAHPAGEFSAQGEQVQHDGHDGHKEQVDHDGAAGGQRVDGGGDPQNEEDVEDVAADDVAQREVVFPFLGGDGAGDEFGQRGAHRDQSQADQRLGEVVIHAGGGRAGQRQTFGAEYDGFSSDGDPHRAQNDEHDRPPQGHILDGFLREVFGVLLGGDDQKDEVRDDPHDEDDTLPAQDGVVVIGAVESEEQPEQKAEERDAQKHRKLFVQSALFDDDGTEQNGNAEHEQDVADIAPDDVAHSDVGVSAREQRVHRVEDRHGEFGKRGPHRDDGQTDDHGRYPEFFCQRGRRVHEDIAELHQKKYADG